jgi:hypothetical protein
MNLIVAGSLIWPAADPLKDHPDVVRQAVFAEVCREEATRHLPQGLIDRTVVNRQRAAMVAECIKRMEEMRRSRRN